MALDVDTLVMESEGTLRLMLTDVKEKTAELARFPITLTDLHRYSEALEEVIDALALVGQQLQSGDSETG